MTEVSGFDVLLLGHENRPTVRSQGVRAVPVLSLLLVMVASVVLHADPCLRISHVEEVSAALLIQTEIDVRQGSPY